MINMNKIKFATLLILFGSFLFGTVPVFAATHNATNLYIAKAEPATPPRATAPATSPAAGNSSPTTPSTDNAAKLDACDGLAQLDSTQTCDTGASKVTNVVKTAVSILSYIVGIAAVIMVILAGFKYTTSGGDSNKISSAKTTLVYALIGLVVAALAQVLVHTVINDSANVSKTAHNSVSAPARFTA